MKKIIVILNLILIIVLSGCIEKGDVQSDSQNNKEIKLSYVISDLTALTSEPNYVAESIFDGIYLKRPGKTSFYSISFLRNMTNSLNEIQAIIDQDVDNSFIVYNNNAIAYGEYTETADFNNDSKCIDAIELFPLASTIYDIQTASEMHPDGSQIEEEVIIEDGSSSDLVSRTYGVAPLSVHFQAENFDGEGFNENFHDYEYVWDFGDMDSGTWETNGKSKNTAIGPVTVHIFENPGNYSVILTKKDKGSIVARKRFNIEVIDPDVFYAGENTICVADTDDFSGAPSGSINIVTNDLSTITPYATKGKRILFRRGSSWIIDTLNFPNNSGPVTLGAYGSGAKPLINITDEKGWFLLLSGKQDWRIMDLEIIKSGETGGVTDGYSDMQRILFLRLSLKGGHVTLGWSHWNNSNTPLTIDQMVVAECEVSDANGIGMYTGGERLALLGNIVKNSNLSHVVRVWQAYKGVISHNIFSGSSLNSNDGRHALKLHGVRSQDRGIPSRNSITLEHTTEYSTISDNIFGSSGPWPVAMGPTNMELDETVQNIIFERNKVIADYGLQNSFRISTSIKIWARYMSIRNNIIDGTGANSSFIGISVDRRGIEPAPVAVKIYNNTIYKPNNTSGNSLVGIDISNDASECVVANNLVSFLGSTVPTVIISNSSSDLTANNNMLAEINSFVDPNNSNPLRRDFRLLSNSSAIDAGDSSISNIFDFDENIRDENIDIGAFESK